MTVEHSLSVLTFTDFPRGSRMFVLTCGTDRLLHVVVRLMNTELQKENTDLKQRLSEYSERYGETSSKRGDTHTHTHCR